MNTATAICACLLLAACSDRGVPPSEATGAGTPAVVPPALRIPAAEDIIEFTAAPQPKLSHFPDFTIDRGQLERILTTWYPVSEEHWRHGYHHVGFCDRTGTITVRDGTTLQWMVRPGGLATLSLPEHTTVFLAKERTPWKQDK